ncbi:hypothetical protein D0B54_12180 [Solimonas sp. K1W22B-7]|uniref:hypothetical protein n=1 Tax=Solimonas sp. K1W22B-7 TaxID=2303331 RepID=UPI000E33588D|nr:hypothetical protein [Solimonas sp. K1W22B-7]AXQ29402.1 hypothetical protein D0B54_12180 [Solimonas sp. K1W22B-7]
MAEPEEPKAPTALELEALIRREVEAQLQKEKSLLKETVGLATKIMGAAVVVFFAAATIAGIASWAELKGLVRKAVIEKAESLIEKANTETSLRDTLRDLLNRTVVAANLAEQKNKGVESLELSTVDWERLRQWIQLPELPREDFANALSVLSAQNQERREKDANLFLSDMLGAQPPFQWMRKQPEKIHTILDAFEQQSMGSAALGLVRSDEVSEKIRIAAAKYVAKVGFTSGVDKLLVAYSESGTGPLKEEVLMTLVTLGENRADVGDLLKKIISERPTEERVETIVRILKSMASENQDATPALPETDLIRYAISNGMRVASFPKHQLPGMNRQDFSKGFEFVIMLSIDNGRGNSRFAGILTLDQFNNWEAYQKLFKEAVASGNPDNYKNLVPRNFSFGPMLASPVHLNLGGGATATVKNSDGSTQELQTSFLKQSFIVLPANVDDRLRFTWSTTDTRENTAELVGVKGDFHLKLVNRFLSKPP